MRTLKLKETTSKSSFLLLAISTFILSLFLFTSCSESESIDGLQDDTTLIEKIESASKITVSDTDLPTSTSIAFNGDLADSFVANVELASGLGYKVAIETDNEAREESKSDVFFTLQGRQLNDTNERRAKKRRKCFEFVFPIDFIMPDDTTITLSAKEDWILIRTWYQENPNTRERAQLVFPVDIILKEDGSTQTLIDRDDLIAVKQNCRAGKDKRKCFKLVLPVTFTMPDASIIEVNERDDFKLVREWYKDNPNATEKGSLNFPVDVEYRDGTVATIEDQTAYDAAKESCQD